MQLSNILMQDLSKPIMPWILYVIPHQVVVEEKAVSLEDSLPPAQESHVLAEVRGKFQPVAHEGPDPVPPAHPGLERMCVRARYRGEKQNEPLRVLQSLCPGGPEAIDVESKRDLRRQVSPRQLSIYPVADLDIHF